MDRQEQYDHKYEVFVLEQVRRYSRMHHWCAKVYILCAAAAFVMGFVAIAMGKPVFPSLYVAAWSIGFFAAKRYSDAMAADTAEIADKIEAAIADPTFDIPDDYGDDVLALRCLVTPTLKNIRSQVIAYGILAVTLWAATALFVLLSFDGVDFSAGFFLISLLMAGMAFCITVLALRAVTDLSAARAYEQYLNDTAAGVYEKDTDDTDEGNPAAN